MTKIKLLTFAVIGLLGINILMVSWFFMQKPNRNNLSSFSKPPVGPKMIIIGQLKFDRDQVAKYEVLIKQHRLMIRNLNDTISVTKKTLYETLKNENVEDQDSLVEKIASLHREIETTHYQHFVDIRKLCKPSQIGNFNRLTEDLASYFTPQRKGLKL